MSTSFNNNSGQGTTTGQHKKRTMSAQQMASFFGTGGIARNETTVTVQKFQETMAEILKQSKITDATLVPVDGSQANLAISAVCLAMKVEDELLMYTMLLEATGPQQLMARRLNLNHGGSREIEIPAVTGDLIDDTTIGHIAAVVKSTIGFTGAIRSVGEHVIHSELDINSTDFPSAARQHLRTAYNALSSDRAIVVGNDVHIDLTEWSSNVFTCRTEHSTVHTIDNNALPVREDLSVSLTVSDPTSGTKNQAVAASNELGRSAGYPELRFTGIIPGMTVIGPNGYPVQSQTTHQPRFVITNTQLETRVFNYQLQLLTLAMTTLFNRNKAWMAAYRPQYVSGGTSAKLRDLTGLGYELGIEINTKEIDTQLILNAHCHDSLTYVLHIPETGETSWFLQLIRAIAVGDQDARAAFIEHGDILTNGHFSRLLPPSDPIARLEEDRVLMGYYVDIDGNMRDIREIDYLAMLNLVGGSDMALVERWDQTYDPTFGPVEERLANRVGILRHVFGDNLHIKGYATSVVLSNQALEALWSAIDKCGVRPRTSNDFEYRTQTRGYAGYADMAMSGSFMNQFAHNHGAAYTSNFNPTWTHRQNVYR
jgi:hypothetical protein